MKTAVPACGIAYARQRRHAHTRPGSLTPPRPSAPACRCGPSPTHPFPVPGTPPPRHHPASNVRNATRSETPRSMHAARLLPLTTFLTALLPSCCPPRPPPPPPPPHQEYIQFLCAPKPGSPEFMALFPQAVAGGCALGVGAAMGGMGGVGGGDGGPAWPCACVHMSFASSKTRVTASAVARSLEMLAARRLPVGATAHPRAVCSGSPPPPPALPPKGAPCLWSDLS